jgi:hypothetical protein
MMNDGGVNWMAAQISAVIDQSRRLGTTLLLVPVQSAAECWCHPTRPQP